MKKIKNQLNNNFLKKHLSKTTKEKCDLAKNYIERKYQKNFEEEKQKKKYYDLLISKMKKMNLNEKDKNIIKNELILNEVKYLREKRKKESILDYQSIEIIGRGAFGEVRLCKHKTGQIVAIKKMNKKEMYKKNQLNHIRAERDILAKSKTNWIVDLKSSFTDFNNLYLVMEYLPGGDLMNLLIEKEVFHEEMAKFYIAEAILAVESVHNLNYIHRDLKPDNILIDKNGHIKLTDFGLCKPYKKNLKIDQGFSPEFENINFGQITKNSKTPKKTKREKVYSMVGTVDYIAPEVFGKNGYTETVDWWSLGTILFEMLMGYPPFYGKDPTTTCKKVINYKKYFEIPPEIEVSEEAVDLLKRLITAPEKRLGRNGVDEIKNHAFFKNLNWEGIRKLKAPVIPKLKSQLDTSNFDKFEETIKWHDEFKMQRGRKRRKKDKDFFWIGYTFKRKRNFKTEEDLKNIFENLKKKKDLERKRLFSAEKIIGVKIKNKKVMKSKKDHLQLNGIDFQYGFNFVKKKKQQKEYFENEKEKKNKYFLDSNKKIFKSLVDSEKNNLNFIKNYNIKKKKVKKNDKLKKSCLKKSKKRKNTPNNKKFGLANFDKKLKLKKLQNKFGREILKKSKNGILKNNFSYKIKNKGIDPLSVKLKKSLKNNGFDISSSK